MIFFFLVIMILEDTSVGLVMVGVRNRRRGSLLALVRFEHNR